MGIDDTLFYLNRYFSVQVPTKIFIIYLGFLSYKYMKNKHRLTFPDHVLTILAYIL